MKTIGNVIWLLLTGLEMALAWFFLGIIWCVTIIGIPFGKQCFKLARVAIWPMGTKVKTDFGKHPIANVIWLLISGIPMALDHLITGALLCLTVVGIPFGYQHFKLAALALIPFGTRVVTRRCFI